MIQLQEQETERIKERERVERESKVYLGVKIGACIGFVAGSIIGGMYKGSNLIMKVPLYKDIKGNQNDMKKDQEKKIPEFIN